MMTNVQFFPAPSAITAQTIAEATGAKLAVPEASDLPLIGIAPLENAEPGTLAFLDNAAYAKFAPTTRASACLISPRFASTLPSNCLALVTPDPYRAFAKAAAVMFPAAQRPQPIFNARGIAPGSFIHPDARLESGVIVDPGVVIGAGAEIGRGTIIAANAVIGPGVRIGRDCAVGPHATIVHALIGNRVIIHAGARIGQDGFGFAMGPQGHLKVPQIGRVILQDDVDIGANTAVDRGANRDTIIGEGTKIDNLVQIGHNVHIGRHCVIVGQVGISGSTVLEDYVVLAGQVGIAGHLRIGMAAQIGAQSGVMTNIPAGQKYGGTPARPAKQHFREVATLSKLASRHETGQKSGQD
jgi:UDP-3-O-[3-hydroxymyristoyl] glucosamine N-acyltransferase